MAFPVAELLILRDAVRVDVSVALHTRGREPNDAFVEVDAGPQNRQPDLRVDVDLRELDREVILVDRGVGVVVLPVPELLNVIDVHESSCPSVGGLIGRCESLPRAPIWSSPRPDPSCPSALPTSRYLLPVTGNTRSHRRLDPPFRWTRQAP